MDSVRFLTAGEQGLAVELGNAIDPAVNAVVHRLAAVLSGAACPGILQMVPTYRSLMIYYDPLIISRPGLIHLVREVMPRCREVVHRDQGVKAITVPVCYGGELGPDLDFVARHNGLTQAQVVEIHSSPLYLVYMLGFLPGFPYLGGMKDSIAVPRLESPRPVIETGSVGIAGGQTGIYPMKSPGGWRIIGRTPLRPFDAGREKPFLFSPGDYIQFRPVSADEYLKIERDSAW